MFCSLASDCVPSFFSVPPLKYDLTPISGWLWHQCMKWVYTSNINDYLSSSIDQWPKVKHTVFPYEIYHLLLWFTQSPRDNWAAVIQVNESPGDFLKLSKKILFAAEKFLLTNEVLPEQKQINLLTSKKKVEMQRKKVVVFFFFIKSLSQTK